MEIATLELMPRDAGSALALTLVCRAVGCRTGEEDRDGGLVLHIVGPKSVVQVLQTLLPRLAARLPDGPRSEVIGYAAAVAERLAEQVMIPSGADQVVEAEFRRRFEVLDEAQASETFDAAGFETGRQAGLDFTLFPIALSPTPRKDRV